MQKKGVVDGWQTGFGAGTETVSNWHIAPSVIHFWQGSLENTGIVDVVGANGSRLQVSLAIPAAGRLSNSRRAGAHTQ